MDLSVVVVVFDMRREAPRTLYSLSRRHQRGLESTSYEIIVVENPSAAMLDAEQVHGLGEEFRYVPRSEVSSSPAAALNEGVESARAERVMLYVDGARLASPGLLAASLRAARLHADPVVATLGWHLGPSPHQQAKATNYTREVEDELLQSSDWQRDGYGLFSVSCLSRSARGGFAGPLPESTALLARRATFDRIGGYDLRFRSAGGGLVNHDLFGRLLEEPTTELILLLDEGTFHQMHGGATTGDETGAALSWTAAHEEYVQIRGTPWTAMAAQPLLVGRLRTEVVPFLHETL